MLWVCKPLVFVKRKQDAQLLCCRPQLMELEQVFDEDALVLLTIHLTPSVGDPTPIMQLCKRPFTKIMLLSITKCTGKGDVLVCQDISQTSIAIH